MIFNIPEFSRSPYALIVLASVFTGFGLAAFLMRRFKVEKQTVRFTALLTFVCTLVVSILISIKFTEDGITIGFSGLGAACGMVLGILISGLIFKDKPDCVMASFVASAPLMYGLAKLGCLFAGCCHGKDYHGPFAVVYHGSEPGSYFPAQLIDMTAFLIIFIVSLILVLKMKNKVTAVRIIIAVTIPVRFLLEYLRYYHDGSLIESGQIFVLVAGAIAVILVFVWEKLLKINYR